MSYEWIDEIDKLIKTLKLEMNNIDTRKRITNKTIKILNKHKIIATINCSASVNTPEVVNHGDFNMQVETGGLSILFRYKQKELLI